MSPPDVAIRNATKPTANVTPPNSSANLVASKATALARLKNPNRVAGRGVPAAAPGCVLLATSPKVFACYQSADSLDNAGEAKIPCVKIVMKHRGPSRGRQRVTGHYRVLGAGTVLVFISLVGLAGCSKKEAPKPAAVAAKPVPATIKNGDIFYESSGQISAMDPETKEVRSVTQGENASGDPAPSADGKKIVYWLTHGNTRSLYVMAPDGTNSVELASLEIENLHPFESDLHIRNRPAWSPDGSRVVYALGGKLFASAGDGSNPITLLTQNANFAPAFSTKGDHLAFIACRTEHDTNLWISDANAGNPTQLTIFTRASAGSPCFSADDAWIYFTKFDDKTSDLWMVSVDGKELKPLTDDGLSAAPTLSPDGQFLLYAHRDKNKDRWTLWQMKVDGTEPREVLDKTAAAPAWAKG